MSATKAQKAESIAEVAAAAKKPSLVFVGFKAVGANDTARLRRVLRQKGVAYRVAKKTLLKRGLDEAKVDGVQPELPGEVAIAWGDDLLAPAREVRAFEKELQGAVSILGGIFDGSFKSQAEMKAIAEIPSRETLLGMLANVLNAPIQKLAMSLKAVADQKAAA